MNTTASPFPAVAGLAGLGPTHPVLVATSAQDTMLTLAPTESSIAVERR